MKIYEQEIEEEDLKEFLVLGVLNETKEIKVLGIIGTFDTQIEAETYIGLENTQFESEGVKYSIYKRVERPESHFDDKNRISQTMANNKKEEMTAEKLSDKITIENVTKQIEDGWTNPFIITEHIVGLDAWRSLPEWDQKILVARVHKIVMENEHLRKIYFAAAYI